MKMSDVIRVSKGVCPQEIGWTRYEPYGEHNVEDMNATVKRILYCVTPTRSVARYFKENAYDLLISHHPFVLGQGIPQLIFHTALDCCEGGLNDMWRDAVGMHPGYAHFDGTLGWVGEIAPTPFRDLCERVKRFSGRIDGEIFLGAAEDKIIRSVVVCSGLGGLVTDLAFNTGADCYILGQCSSAAMETGFRALIETGHTASEWCGVLFFRKIFPELKVDLAPADLDVFGTEVFQGSALKTKVL